jgi:hypothetical protein
MNLETEVMAWKGKAIRFRKLVFQMKGLLERFKTLMEDDAEHKPTSTLYRDIVKVIAWAEKELE